MGKSHVEPFIPDTEPFRHWLTKVLPLIGTNAHRLAKDAGVAVNSCQKFLKKEQDDLRLATASRLYLEAMRQAKSRGVILPELDHETLANEVVNA